MDRLVIQKLTKRAQFLFVREGFSAARPNLVVEARRRAEDGHAGVGFTTSKKVGNAVTRNRARRRLREAARALLPELGLPGVDYVLVARPGAADAHWAGLLDDVRNALLRLRTELETAAVAARGARPGRRRNSHPT